MHSRHFTSRLSDQNPTEARIITGIMWIPRKQSLNPLDMEKMEQCDWYTNTDLRKVSRLASCAASGQNGEIRCLSRCY
jgi:hypothetical protein